MTQNPDLDPFTAEQLLSGAPVDGEVGPLADLLAAAAASARADELTGEAAAVAAFRDAAGASRPAAAPAAFTGSRRGLGFKVAIAVAAVAGTGIAGTAAAGLLPGDAHQAPVAAPTSATPGTSSAASGTATTTTSTPTHPRSGTGPPQTHQTPSERPTKPSHAPTKSAVRPTPAQPTAEVMAMCRAYSTATGFDEDRRRSDRNFSDRLLDEPYFQPLVDAAGGKNKVAAFCKHILKQGDSDSQGEQAPAVSAPPRQFDRPSGRPTSDPTSRPAASKTGIATTALPPPRGR